MSSYAVVQFAEQSRLCIWSTNVPFGSGSNNNNNNNKTYLLNSSGKLFFEQLQFDILWRAHHSIDWLKVSDTTATNATQHLFLQVPEMIYTRITNFFSGRSSSVLIL